MGTWMRAADGAVSDEKERAVNAKGCPRCNHYGWRGCEMHERLAFLAANLEIAGGLCRAFRLGFDEGWNVTGEGFNSEYTSPRFKWPADYEDMATNGGTNSVEWRPGCAKPAPCGGKEGQ